MRFAQEELTRVPSLPILFSWGFKQFPAPFRQSNVISKLDCDAGEQGVVTSNEGSVSPCLECNSPESKR
jgi:hypothetical protein